MRNAKKVLARTSVSFAVLAGICGGAAATENFDLRYAPGIGGADMSAPVDPGLYLQVSAYSYSARKVFGSSSTVTPGAAFLSAGQLSVFPNARATTASYQRIDLRVRGLMPRVLYMSTTQFLGATIGATALLPLVEKQADVTANVGTTTVTGMTGAPSGTIAAIAAGVNAIGVGRAQTAIAAGGKKFGVGDLEIAPVFRWNRDPDQILFVPTVILPTGSYNHKKLANPSAGKFYTFRPSVQYSHIGEGFDFGARLSFSMNTKNDDTDYKSGNYFNLDMSFMKSLSDAFRVGVAGYAVLQTSNDTYSGKDAITDSQAHTVGRKGQVFALGPAVAYIKGAGEMLLEARVLKEFSAVDRPEGTAVWFNFAMPIQ